MAFMVRQSKFQPKALVKSKEVHALPVIEEIGDVCEMSKLSKQ